MPATPLPATTRYFAPEISKVWLATTLASAAAITRAEINSSTDLTGEIESVAGWTVNGQMINTPDWGSRFISQIAGRTSAEGSSITFYASKDGHDIREVLARGDRAYVIFADGGDVAGQPCDIFAIEVTAVGKVRSGENAQTITVQFAITRVPAENVALPALT